jgi:hypothetical protein
MYIKVFLSHTAGTPPRRCVTDRCRDLGSGILEEECRLAGLARYHRAVSSKALSAQVIAVEFTKLGAGCFHYSLLTALLTAIFSFHRPQSRHLPNSAVLDSVAKQGSAKNT